MKSVDILKEKGIEYRLIELSDQSISFKDVIKNSDLNPDEICKTIIVEGEKRYAVFLKGDQKIDFAKLKEVIGKCNIISFKDLKKDYGEPGTICPITVGLPLLVDKRVLETEKINFGSGDLLYGLEMNTKDLEKVVEYKVVDVGKS